MVSTQAAEVMELVAIAPCAILAQYNDVIENK